ncbi:MAG: FAD-dependent monooxygenase, partial [Candidatus Competibacterales bacterium]|nr:FAD-dependent monooxygenase [Candidatus Competibacterales bacterium]
MSADYDVVIAGGGPVGAALACALSGQGLRLAVIEARAPAAGPQDDVRTLALAYGSRRILEALDLWSALPATPIHRIHVSEQGGCGVTRLDSDELQVPALGYVVTAADLGRVLQDRARSRPDIDWLCPATIDTVSLHPEAARIGLLAANGSRILQSRLLVAADGGRSAVRERLGLGVLRRDYHQDAIIANLSLARSHGHIAYERFTPDGPLALLPLEQQRGALVMTVPRTRRDAVLGLDEHAFTERVAAGFGGRLPRITACSARQHYPLQLVQAHQTVRHRAVVIGNAAHTLH